MRAATALLALLLAWAAPADQRAPELEDLFSQLRVADSAAHAMAVEAHIWRLWLQSGDEHEPALVAPVYLRPPAIGPQKTGGG